MPTLQSGRQRPPLVAACFAVQLQDSVPLEPTDQRVDGVLTEREAYGIAAEL